MDAKAKLELIVREALRTQDLESSVRFGESQFLYVGYYVVRLVLFDEGQRTPVAEVLQELKQQQQNGPLAFEFQVQAKWELERMGELQPLHLDGGGLVAASVVNAYLRAGTSEKTAHVIITWSAGKAIRELIPQASLIAVADAVVRERLTRGGASAWDPSAEPTIEINAAAAPYVSRLLQKAA